MDVGLIETSSEESFNRQATCVQDWFPAQRHITTKRSGRQRLPRKLSPAAAGSGLFNSRSWGYATLHPRLYAVACFAGWIGLLALNSDQIAGREGGFAPALLAGTKTRSRGCP